MRSKPSRRTLWRFAVIVGLCGVLTIAGTLTVSWDRIQAWWYRIPVARSWDALLDVRPRKIDDHMSVCLAIEANETLRYGGVLLYALVTSTDGHDLRSPGSNDTVISTSIGFKVSRKPSLLFVTAHRDSGTLQETRKVLEEGRLFASLYPTPVKAVFYVFPLPVDEPGRYVIQVRTSTDDLIGTASLEVSARAHHVWMSAGPSRKLRALTRRTGKPSAAAVHLVAPGNEAAIPDFGDSLLFEKEPDRSSTRSLHFPRLVPEDDETRPLEIESGPSSLLITAAERLDLTWARDKLLFRWWVDGEAYIPSQPFANVGLGNERIHRGSPNVGKSLRIHMEFDGERLGAVPGATIEVQVLFAERGWWKISRLNSLEERWMGRPDSYRVFISPRIKLRSPIFVPPKNR